MSMCGMIYLHDTADAMKHIKHVQERFGLCSDSHKIAELQSKIAALKAELAAKGDTENPGATAIKVVCEEMQKDAGWAWSWHCAIAMSSKDAGLENNAAQRAAASFMRMAFGVDTSKSQNFDAVMSTSRIQPYIPPANARMIARDDGNIPKSVLRVTAPPPSEPQRNRSYAAHERALRGPMEKAVTDDDSVARGLMRAWGM